jgi:hypothetical protein
MSIALHVCRKDALRFRLWLLAYLVACLSPFAVSALPFEPARVVIGNLVPFVRLGLFLLLVAMVVQEDPLVDPAAFWPTRPIGGGALFAGKLLFIGGLLVLPAAICDLVQVAVAGLAWKHLMLAVPEILLDWSMWAAGMAMAAAFTTTLAGILGVGLRMALLWLVVASILAAAQYLYARSMGEPLGVFVSRFFADRFASDEMRQALASIDASRTLVVWLLDAVGWLAVAFVLYRTRRTRPAWALAAVIFAVVATTGRLWRWDFFGGSAAASSAATRKDEELASRLQVRIESQGRTTTMAMKEAPAPIQPQKTLHARILVTGADPPLAVEVARVTGAITFADGSRMDAASGPESQRLGSWNPTVVESLIGAHVVNLDEQALDTALLTAPAPEYDRHAGQTGRLDVQVGLAIKRYRIAAELPAEVGATYDDGVVHSELRTVANHDGSLQAMLADTQVSLLLLPRAAVHRRMLFMRFNPDVLYVLRNRRRGEAFWPANGATFGFGSPSRTRIDHATMILSYASTPESGPRIDDAWLAGADLVRLESEPVVDSSQHVVVPDFTIPAFEISAQGP